MYHTLPSSSSEKVHPFPTKHPYDTFKGLKIIILLNYFQSNYGGVSWNKVSTLTNFNAKEVQVISDTLFIFIQFWKIPRKCVEWVRMRERLQSQFFSRENPLTIDFIYRFLWEFRELTNSAESVMEWIWVNDFSNVNSIFHSVGHNAAHAL